MLSTNKTNQRVTTLAATLAAFCLSLMIVQPANADPITGEVAFMGFFAATGGSGPLDLEHATGIDFTSGIVVQSTGAFAANGVMPFSSVALQDFQFAPFYGPVDPLWAVGVFQFALQSLTAVDQGVSHLALSGTGIVSSTKAGLDPTVFNWSFSGDNSGGTLQLYTSTATRVAEPSDLGTLAFLIVGMAALGVWSRKHRNAVHQ